MKNLFKSVILIIAILGTINSLAASTSPIKEKGTLVINESEVTFSLLKSRNSKAFNNITYNGITKIIKIDAKTTIAFVEITNENGELEFLMPVGAKVLNIDLIDFAKGIYNVNIKMQSTDNKIIHSSLVKAF